LYSRYAERSSLTCSGQNESSTNIAALSAVSAFASENRAASMSAPITVDTVSADRVIRLST
jgi:hypothetical protein